MEPLDRLGSRLLHWKITELLATWPTTAQAFSTFRVACVGCAFDTFHTLADAIQAYDLKEQDFLSEIGRHIPELDEASAQTRPGGDTV